MWHGETFVDISNSPPPEQVHLHDLPLNPTSTQTEDVIASRLAHLTRESGSALFGGDLESALSVLRSVANRLAYRLQQEARLYNKREHVVQIYQVMWDTFAPSRSVEQMPFEHGILNKKPISTMSI